MQPNKKRKPSPDEVRVQLQRILASPIFRGSSAQAKLLDKLVKRTLKNKPTTEMALGLELCGDGFAPSTNPWVRVTIAKLRHSLPRYYSARGRTDPIIIRIPRPQNQLKSHEDPKTSRPQRGRVREAPGQSYKPEFERNPLHPQEKLLRLGLRHIKSSLNHCLGLGLRYLNDVDTGVAEPDVWIANVEATVVFADTLKYDPDCTEAIIDGNTVITFDSPQKLVEFLLQKAEEYLWNAHLAGAERWIVDALDACIDISRGDFEKACISIDWACTNNGSEEQVFLRFPMLYEALFYTNRMETALRLTKEQAEKYYDDPVVQCTYAKYLLRGKRYDDAKAVIDYALKLERNDVHANIMLLQFYQDTEKMGDYASQRSWVLRLLDEIDHPWFKARFPP